MSKMPVNGPWVVTTDAGDGSPTVRLGVWEGPIDVIAFVLADKAIYTLRFEPLTINSAECAAITGLEAHVVVREYGADDVRALLRSRPVSVEASQFYGAVKLRARGMGYQDKWRDAVVGRAMKKLTEEEYIQLRDTIIEESRK